MPGERLRKFLDENGILYASILHSPAYTAQEVAQSAHIPGKDLAKTVIVKLDGELAMVVLPASYRIDLELLRGATGADKVELASEEEFQRRFPDAELGAMPPFGNLYGMDVFAAEVLADDEHMAFNAGTHNELIRMTYEDFAKLVEPDVVCVSSAYGT